MKNAFRRAIAGAFFALAATPAIAQPLSFQRAHIATFDTKAAAEAATVNSGTLIIRTRGYAAANDGGGAVYSKLPCPGTLKTWHIRTNAGAGTCYVIDAAYPVPLEAFGFVSGGGAGTDATNDTAFAALEEAVNTADLGIKRVFARRGATYHWAAGTPSGTALALDGVRGFELDCQGALFSARFSTNARVGFVSAINNASHNKVTACRGEQPNLAISPSYGVDWFITQSGAAYNDFQGVFNGGIQGYASMRNLTTPVGGRSHHNKVDIETTNVAYALANQADGDFEDYKVRCEGAFRCLIAYNATGNKYRLAISNAASHSQSNQVLLKSYGHNYAGETLDFTGHKVEITLAGTAYGVTPTSPMINIQHDQYACSGSTGYATTVQADITIDGDLGSDADRYQMLMANDSLTCVSGSTAIGVPSVGVNVDAITLGGSLRGNVAGSGNAFELGLSARGYSATQIQSFTFKNLSMRDLTRPMVIDTSAFVVLDGVDAPSMGFTFNAGAENRLSHISSNTGLAAANDLYRGAAGVPLSFSYRGDSHAWDFWSRSGGTYFGGFNAAGTGMNLRSPNGNPQLEVRDGYINVPVELRVAGSPVSGMSFTRVQSSSNYTLSLSDAGKMIQNTNSGGMGLTIPPNSSVALPIGTVIELNNNGGDSSFINVNRGAGVTLYRPSDGTNGNATIGARRRGMLTKIDSDVWTLDGTGIASNN